MPLQWQWEPPQNVVAATSSMSLFIEIKKPCGYNLLRHIWNPWVQQMYLNKYFEVQLFNNMHLTTTLDDRTNFNIIYIIIKCQTKESHQIRNRIRDHGTNPKYYKNHFIGTLPRYLIHIENKEDPQNWPSHKLRISPEYWNKFSVCCNSIPLDWNTNT